MKDKKILIIILLVAVFLRLYRLSVVPVSLFGDELDVGYHAFSILNTLRDYQGNFLPLHFHSLAEWRTPLYLYSVVPTVSLFGISPFGVRLPAAIFGILGVWGLYLLVKKLFNDEKLALVAAFFLAISPWHIQYSRAAFEVTQLLAFLIFGLYFFFRSFEKGKYLWVSVALLVFTPWIYSTAKLFTPILLVFLFILWRKDILNMTRSNLVKAIITGLVVGIPIAYSTLFGGGAQRAGYISVFTDPTREKEIGFQRQLDADVRGEVHAGLQPTVTDKLFHNKLVFWSERVLENYNQSFSADFLFINGDPNLRHSIEGIGQFYKIEVIGLVLGLILLFTRVKDKKLKSLIAFWVLVGAFPSAITREGGHHATRLILMLPPLIILIAYGIVGARKILSSKTYYLFLLVYLAVLATKFVFYQHDYWVHNPWNSERWWHYGWQEAVQSAKEIEKDYDNVVISMAGEPAWIFFAGWYEYPADRWQENFPIGNDVELPGFDKVSHIDKFYFGSPNEGGLYDWGKVINSKTLYVANGKEVGVNLVKEPERTPTDLSLVKSIAYPSGEPAFYLFSGK